MPASDRNKFYFESGFFDLKNKNFTTGKAKVHLKKIYLTDQIMTQEFMVYPQVIKIMSLPLIRLYLLVVR